MVNLEVDSALASEARDLQRGAHLAGARGRNGGAKPKSFTIERDAHKQTVIKTGDKDDVIGVRALTKGRLEVDVNGEKTVLSKKQVAAGVIIDAEGGNDRVTIDAGVKVGLGVRGGAGNDVVQGGSGDDSIDGGAGGDVIHGGKGHDLIFGGEGADIIQGGEGDDRIGAGAGDDTVLGDAGHDKILGGDGHDNLHGGEGDDYLEGNGGRDTITGGDGRDTLHGGKDADHLDAGAGDDYVDGGKGDDHILGRDGHDRLMGGQGDDKIDGGADRDVIAGGYGKDTVDGGAGGDKIYGEGRDTLAKDASDTLHTLELSGDESRYGLKHDRLGHRVSGQLVPADATPEARKNIEEFNDRLEDDLDTMRSLPSGRALLERVDKAYDKLGGYVFVEGKFSKNDAADLTAAGSTIVRYDRTDHRWTENVEKDWQKAPNVIGLYHELVHAVQFAEKQKLKGKTGGVDNSELAAVGLPYDHDRKRKTPLKQPDASDVYENRFRADLEYEKRTEY